MTTIKKRSKPYKRHLKSGICSYCGKPMLTMQMKKILLCGDCNIGKVTQYRKDMKATWQPFRFE